MACSQHASASDECSGGIRTVVTGNCGSIDLTKLGRPSQNVVSDDSDEEICQESNQHEACRLPVKVWYQPSQPFATFPADVQQQLDRQALVNGLGEFQFDMENWDQETGVEEQQQRFKKIMSEVIDKVLKHD